MNQNTMNKSQKRKLRRQTGIIDVSCIPGFPGLLDRNSACSDTSDPEYGAQITPEPEDYSQSISEHVDSGSLEHIDRLSILSDTAPDLLRADTFSEYSAVIDPVSADHEPECRDNAEDKEGWRVIPITVVQTQEIVIQRETPVPPESDTTNVSHNQVSRLPDNSNQNGNSARAQNCDLERQTPVCSATATPSSELKKRARTSVKNSSPASVFLEKSASWISSLSGSKTNKSFKAAKKATKKSLTSLFEAVSSSSSNSNNNLKAKDLMSTTLPMDVECHLNKTISSPERLGGMSKTASDFSFLSNSHLSNSSVSLSELYAETGDSNASLGPIKRVKHEDKNDSSLSQQRYSTWDPRKVSPTSHSSRKSMSDKKLLQGVKQFNLDPKKGLEFLDKNGLLDASQPEAIATFLFREGRLSKKQIGAFIGDHKDLNKQVLIEFVKKHEFMNLILVQALRQFLWSFRLPGEAMQIDRIMEAFAKHYCDQNPNLFDESDTCYILSFSIIMLNTALHNPNVRQKITLEQFVAQNRGINSGKDLPRDILELIYRNIKDEPFKIPTENYDDLMYTFFSPEKEGWLLKQGGNWKTWKRRWFVLSDRCLYYFEHTTENIPKGIIPLENVKIRAVDDKENKNFCFEVYSESNVFVKGCKTDSKGTVVQGHHKSYRMCASSAEDRDVWLEAIRDSIKEHPFYDIITAKKSALRRKSLRHVQHHDIPSPATPIVVSSTTSQQSPNDSSFCVQT